MLVGNNNNYYNNNGQRFNCTYIGVWTSSNMSSARSDKYGSIYIARVTLRISQVEMSRGLAGGRPEFLLAELTLPNVWHACRLILH